MTIESNKSRTRPLKERLLRRIQLDPQTGCHNWTGARDAKGYGRIGEVNPRRTVLTHRAAYELTHGSIPDGMVIDHLCRNPSCCNPAHLEVVTPRENTLRGIGISATHAKKTTCPRGHPFDVQRASGQRSCRACSYERARQAYAKSRPRRFFTALSVAGAKFLSTEDGVELHQPGKPVLLLTHRAARDFVAEHGGASS